MAALVGGGGAGVIAGIDGGAAGKQGVRLCWTAVVLQRAEQRVAAADLGAIAREALLQRGLGHRLIEQAADVMIGMREEPGKHFLMTRFVHDLRREEALRLEKVLRNSVEPLAREIARDELNLG